MPRGSCGSCHSAGTVVQSNAKPVQAWPKLGEAEQPGDSTAGSRNAMQNLNPDGKVPCHSQQDLEGDTEVVSGVHLLDSDLMSAVHQMRCLPIW